MAGYAAVVVSIFSLLLAGYTFLSKANKENTTELTTVIVKLESISMGIADIKTEINTIKSDQKEDHDKLIQIEASIKSAWRQIDAIAGKRKEHKDEEENK